MKHIRCSISDRFLNRATAASQLVWFDTAASAPPFSTSHALIRASKELFRNGVSVLAVKTERTGFKARLWLQTSQCWTIVVGKQPPWHCHFQQWLHRVFACSIMKVTVHTSAHKSSQNLFFTLILFFPHIIYCYSNCTKFKIPSSSFTGKIWAHIPTKRRHRGTISITTLLSAICCRTHAVMIFVSTNWGQHCYLEPFLWRCGRCFWRLTFLSVRVWPYQQLPLISGAHPPSKADVH